MAIPRALQINLKNPGWVHCTARCVRQAFLAGDRFEHRRGWIERRLQFLAGVFGCEIAAFSAMSNHLHVIVRMAPEAVEQWSAEEVALRWLRAYPGYRDDVDRSDAATVEIEDWKVTARASDAEWIAERRQRLASLSWFMRTLCEPIARRANLEDDCSGRFWEGRFSSTPLLDDAALLACMVYVDLNPIRAKMATAVEDSDHTSVQLRLAAAQASLQSEVTAYGEATAADADCDHAGTDMSSGLNDDSDDDGRRPVSLPIERRCDLAEPTWLASLGRLTARDSSTGYGGLSPLQYCRLVETTGRIVRGDKRGAVAGDLPDLLARLDPAFDLSSWVLTMCGWRQMSAGSVGSRASLRREAERRGLAHARTRCALFRRRPAPPDTTAA